MKISVAFFADEIQVLYGNETGVNVNGREVIKQLLIIGFSTVMGWPGAQLLASALLLATEFWVTLDLATMVLFVVPWVFCRAALCVRNRC